MPLKNVLEILPLRNATISKLLAACVLKNKVGGRREGSYLSPLIIYPQFRCPVLGYISLCFLLIFQMFQSILSKKVYLMAFHIWKSTSFSLHFPVGNREFTNKE